MLNGNISKCEHIKTNGVRCGSPALRDEKFCYFHHRARRDFPHRAELAADPKTTGGAAPFPAGEGAPRTALDIPFPEDADAIQYGLGKVIYGLLNGLIDHKSAGLVLYALQTASGNLKNTSLFKRSQKADEEDRSNVSPLLAYYLGPSREDYSRVFRILQDAEADLKNKTREIAELKERLGEPCEEDATADATADTASKQSSWVERMHEAAAIEPREERYSRNVEPARVIHQPSSKPTNWSENTSLGIDASADTTAPEVSPVGAAYISPARKRWVKREGTTEPRRGDTTRLGLEVRLLSNRPRPSVQIRVDRCCSRSLWIPFSPAAPPN